MQTDNTELVERLAAILLGRVNAPEQEIYRTARAILPIIEEREAAARASWAGTAEIEQVDRDAAIEAWDAACLADLYYTPIGEENPNETPEGKLAQCFAAHRLAARAAGAADMRERAAQLVQKRMDDRFDEHGTREPDTNATYYSGRYGETLETLDEEDEAIRNAIAALEPKP